ncbi:unnamed protein product [Cunninghamella echinulata]
MSNPTSGGKTEEFVITETRMVEEKTEQPIITSTTTTTEQSQTEEKTSSSSSTDNKDVEAVTPTERHRPNKGRLLIRFWQLLAPVGCFGFQYGATPYSGVPFIFEDAKLQYYTYAINLVAFLWAAFMIFIYLSRRFGSNNNGKMKRPILFAVDAALATLFGVSSFYQFASYNCPPSYYNGWCNFHNTGKFFLLSLFISYVINMLWDLFGGLSCLRSRKD